MSMTKKEKMLKLWLIRKLKSQGYLTYAKILREFDVRLDNRPDIVAYMSPINGEIALSPYVDDTQASVLVRHEILHGFLQHEKRLLDKLAKERGLDPKELSDIDLKDLRTELYKDSTFNIAGDYEISNRGYTEKDKDTVRHIILNGQIVSGLVTEDDHPDWVDMSIEEMYDELRKQEPEPDQNAVLGALQDPTTFVGIDGIVYGV